MKSILKLNGCATNVDETVELVVLTAHGLRGASAIAKSSDGRTALANVSSSCNDDAQES